MSRQTDKFPAADESRKFMEEVKKIISEIKKPKEIPFSNELKQVVPILSKDLDFSLQSLREASSNSIEDILRYEDAFLRYSKRSTIRIRTSTIYQILCKGTYIYSSLL